MIFDKNIHAFVIKVLQNTSDNYQIPSIDNIPVSKLSIIRLSSLRTQRRSGDIFGSTVHCFDCINPVSVTYRLPLTDKIVKLKNVFSLFLKTLERFNSTTVVQLSFAFLRS